MGDDAEAHHLPCDELLILSRVGQVGNDRVDLRPFLAEAVGGEKQLEEVVVGWRGGRLDDQDCLCRNFLLESQSYLFIAADLDLVTAEWQACPPGDAFTPVLRRG